MITESKPVWIKAYDNENLYQSKHVPVKVGVYTDQGLYRSGSISVIVYTGQGL